MRCVLAFIVYLRVKYKYHYPFTQPDIHKYSRVKYKYYHYPFTQPDVYKYSRVKYKYDYPFIQSDVHKFSRVKYKYHYTSTPPDVHKYSRVKYKYHYPFIQPDVHKYSRVKYWYLSRCTQNLQSMQTRGGNLTQKVYVKWYCTVCCLETLLRNVHWRKF